MFRIKVCISGECCSPIINDKLFEHSHGVSKSYTTQVQEQYLICSVLLFLVSKMFRWERIKGLRSAWVQKLLLTKFLPPMPLECLCALASAKVYCQQLTGKLLQLHYKPKNTNLSCIAPHCWCCFALFYTTTGWVLYASHFNLSLFSCPHRLWEHAMSLFLYLTSP